MTVLVSFLPSAAGSSVTMSALSEGSEARGSAEAADDRFDAAPADLPTKVLVYFTVLIMAVLIAGGLLQLVLAAGNGDAGGIARGAGFGLLGLAVVLLLSARVPTAYRLEEDAAFGTLLVIERRRFAPVRLALSRYETAEGARRVVFPWVPLLSGSRFLGLRGAKVEESLAGFWSFGRDGSRSVIFSGSGRPRTLVSPLDPAAFLDSVGARPDVAHLKGGTLESLGVAGCELTLMRGDITLEVVDAIVNAANSSLLGGGGVDGAIHEAGGPEILAGCQAYRAENGPLPTGKAMATSAGRLHARRVIHTVGPVWSGGTAGEVALLAEAYTSSLTVAAGEGLRTVSFPSISTGAYGYPLAAAADVALRAVTGFLRAHPGAFDEVRFVLFGDAALAAYRTALARIADDSGQMDR